MSTWFKFRAKERKCIVTIKGDEIVNIPTLDWLDFPTQVDLETKRITHFQPLVIIDEGDKEITEISDTLIYWTDGSQTLAAYNYDNFRKEILPKYNKLIDQLDVILKIAEDIASNMSDQEIALMMKRDAE